jgi:hypothetical protein
LGLHLSLGHFGADTVDIVAEAALEHPFELVQVLVGLV